MFAQSHREMGALRGLFSGRRGGGIGIALTDVTVRSAKPRDKEYKLADSAGLYLLVTPAGGKLGRLKYRIYGV